MTTHVLQNKFVPVSAPGPKGTPGAKTDFHTDLGNARRFVRRHAKNIRFIPEWHKWIVWNGSRWEIDDNGAAMRLGSVARLVGIEGGVVSGVFNLESSDVEAPDWRPRHDEHYHEA